MSMLAEPKRKKKWSLNPRGKFWSNDDTKLGQKLLEKMGWSKGKGLGREEQGDLEPVRLKYKNDAEGVGFVAKDDQWIAHHEEFNAILGKLNGADTPAPVPDTVAVKSLEVRSKVSKARVHYHKFTRGKDLSRYSESDLASILGKRVASGNPSSDDEKTEIKFEVKEEIVQQVEVKEEASESSNNREHSHGVTTINKGNIHEYFAAKMAALKAKSPAAQLITPEQMNDEAVNTEKRVRINEDLNQVKEFCSKKRITEWSQEANAKSGDSDSETEKKKSKKKKKKVLPAEAGEAVMLDETEEVEPPKSKKRKLDADVESANDKDTETPKKKKKKDKGNQENCPPIQTNTDEDTESNETKKSKKKKKKERSDEDAEITQQTKVAEPSETEEPPKKKKKKNKSEVDAGSAANQSLPDDPEMAETKKSKKKKSQLEDEDSCTAASSEDTLNQGTLRKKKNKKKKKEVIEDPTPATQQENQSDPLAETTGLPGAMNGSQSDNTRTANPSGAANNYPVPDFSFIDRPSKVEESIAKYQTASFEMFKGANLFAIAGYGNSC